MDGKQITVTQDGDFSQAYLLASGYNRIVLDAKDQYGRTREKVLEIMYEPPTSPGQAPAASTTPAQSVSSQPGAGQTATSTQSATSTAGASQTL